MDLRGCRAIFVTEHNRYREGIIVTVLEHNDHVVLDISVDDKIHANVPFTDILDIYTN